MKADGCWFRFGSTVIASLLLGACQTAPPPSWNLPPEVRTLETNSYPMAYTDQGTGPVVVLVHGGIADYRWWEANREALATRFRVVAVSLRHYYPEPWDGKGTFSAKGQADDLSRFIEGLRTGPVALVGHSRGGLIAADVAVRRPELVRKLVLGEPTLNFAPLPTIADDTPAMRFQREVNARFEKDGPEAGLAHWHELFGKGTWAGLPEEERARRRQNAWTITRLSDLRVDCTDLGMLKMPVLLIGGANSPPLFKAQLTAVQKCIPSASQATIPNAAHPMNRHNPAAFNDVVMKFLVQ